MFGPSLPAYSLTGVESGGASSAATPSPSPSRAVHDVPGTRVGAHPEVGQPGRRGSHAVPGGGGRCPRRGESPRDTYGTARCPPKKCALGCSSPSAWSACEMKWSRAICAGATPKRSAHTATSEREITGRWERVRRRRDRRCSRDPRWGRRCRVGCAGRPTSQQNRCQAAELAPRGASCAISCASHRGASRVDRLFRRGRGDAGQRGAVGEIEQRLLRGGDPPRRDVRRGPLDVEAFHRAGHELDPSHRGFDRRPLTGDGDGGSRQRPGDRSEHARRRRTHQRDGVAAVVGHREHQVPRPRSPGASTRPTGLRGRAGE